MGIKSYRLVRYVISSKESVIFALWYGALDIFMARKKHALLALPSLAVVNFMLKHCIDWPERLKYPLSDGTKEIVRVPLAEILEEVNTRAAGKPPQKYMISSDGINVLNKWVKSGGVVKLLAAAAVDYKRLCDAIQNSSNITAPET